MAMILNIDTATEFASVCLTENERLLALEVSCEQKNHASFLQPAIDKIRTDLNIDLTAIDAVAVTIGPGSYTGLRVGLASAKGLCFALNKPLIAVNTLEVMALHAIRKMKEDNTNIKDFLFCPMIDARRMEVFMAVYTDQLVPFIEPSAMILTENSFSDIKNRTLAFSGSVKNKLSDISNNKNFVFLTFQHNAYDLSIISKQRFDNKLFASLAYCEPLYLKEFYNTRLQ